MDDEYTNWPLNIHQVSLTLFQEHGSRRRSLLLEFLRKKYATQLAEEEPTIQRHPALVISIKNQLAMLSDDLLLKILVLLPAESLFVLQFVCKKWFELINDPGFIRCHAQKSEAALYYKKLTLLEPGSHPLQYENKLKSYFHYVDLNNGADHFIESSIIELEGVKASCDGLIIASLKKNAGLMILNLVTRKCSVLPSASGWDFIGESYGVAFCSYEKTYKVVHLFYQRDASIGCEILSLCSKSWRPIEGHDMETFREIVRDSKPVSLSGSLYWLPRRHSSNYFVSMNVQDEKFITKKLPSCHRRKDKLMEIGGSLGFVSDCEEDNATLQVWILANDGETWMKHFRIVLNDDMVGSPYPVCSIRNGKDIVLEDARRWLYVHAADTGEVRLLHSGEGAENGWYERFEKVYITHHNTLVSWEK